jgi:hypothetical protein
MEAAGGFQEMIFSIDPSCTKSHTSPILNASASRKSVTVTIFLLSAASPKWPATNVAMVAPRNPSARPIAIAMGSPSCGGIQTIMTMAHDPTIMPVAMRGSLRAIVSSKRHR